MGDPEQPLLAVLETTLYHSSEESGAMLELYRDVLGLPLTARWPDGVALRLGAGVVLLFDRERLAEREGPIADHSTEGSGHACFLAGRGDYEAWRERLRQHGVEIDEEHDWGGGRRSFYFRDPANNLLEIADDDIWSD